MKSLAKRLELVGTLSESDRYRYEALSEYVKLDKALEKLKESHDIQVQTELDSLIISCAKKSYIDERGRYREANKYLTNYYRNKRMRNLVEGIKRDTAGKFADLARGMAIRSPNGEIHPLNKALKHSVDRALIYQATGVFSHQEASKKVIDEFAKTGLTVVHGTTGRAYKVDSYTNLLLRTSLNRLSSEMTKLNMEDMGECYVEVSAHLGARPSHADWQGKIYYYKEMDTRGDNNSANYPDFVDSTGYGSGEGLGGYNCRHSFYPYFVGYSTPAYTKEELENYDKEVYTYRDKTYTSYEVTQKQRSFERAIRESKLKILGYNELKNTDYALYESVKLRRLNDEYKVFSQATNQRAKLERTRVYGYNRSVSGSVVNKIVDATILDILNKNWSEEFKNASITTYKDLKKEGYVASSHFIARYQQRKKDKKYKEISFKDLLHCLNKGANFKEGTSKLVYFSVDDCFCCIQNSKNKELVSFVRRKTKKKEWDDL